MSSLYIDHGNSSCKWCSDGANNVHSGNLGDLRKWLAMYPQQSVYIASVSANAAALAALFGCDTVVTWLQSKAQWHELTNAYSPPNGLGVDRWCAMIAAWASLRHQSLCVISCGSATTIDFVNADGRHLGGLITLGVTGAFHALAGATNLPIVTVRERIQPYANNTQDAINSGILGMIVNWLNAQIQQQLPSKIVVYGGNSGIIAKHLQYPYVIQDHLALTGIQLQCEYS